MRVEHILIILTVIIILSVLKVLKLDHTYHYRRIKYLLSKHELKFYSELVKLIPAGYTVMAKVRLADVIKSVDFGRKGMYGFNKIKSKHLDFVIIDSQTSEIKVAIELNDSSHRLFKRKMRDEFLSKILDSLEIPLVIITTSQYDYLREQLKKILI